MDTRIWTGYGQVGWKIPMKTHSRIHEQHIAALFPIGEEARRPMTLEMEDLWCESTGARQHAYRTVGQIRVVRASLEWTGTKGVPLAICGRKLVEIYHFL